MQFRTLGRSGLNVSASVWDAWVCPIFTADATTTNPSPPSIAPSNSASHFLDTADVYGPYKNEELVGKAIKGKRDEVVLATKFGIVRDPKDPHVRGVNGKPDYVRKSVRRQPEAPGRSKHIDLYYQHRVDPNTPIEDTVGAMADLVKEGKVRYIGLSEAGAQTLRRAAKVHPIAALQTEYSLWTRDPEEEILPTCRELGIGFVAYSPLGRGFLTGQFKKFDDFQPDDYRRNSPRFQGENFQKNLDLVERVEEIARRERLQAVATRAGVGARRRETTSFRSPAPSAVNIWKKTSPRSM